MSDRYAVSVVLCVRGCTYVRLECLSTRMNVEAVRLSVRRRGRLFTVVISDLEPGASAILSLGVFIRECERGGVDL